MTRHELKGAPFYREGIGNNPLLGGFGQDVLAGLQSRPKSLNPKYFYDTIGSRLYKQITQTPEYYLTRTELGILRGAQRDLAELLAPCSAVVEFGSGSEEKVECLLKARPDIAIYAPVDTSPDMMEMDKRVLKSTWPNVSVIPIVADFTEPVVLPSRLQHYPRVGFFPGSTIGNFAPPEAGRLLRTLGKTLGPNSLLIIGVDLVKDPARLHAAYNDAAGITARFNKNLLVRIRRELDADIDVSGFRHEAIFNTSLSRIEMRLRATRRQTARIGGASIGFEAGEAIYTESSYKFTVEGFHALAAAGGWRPFRTFMDEERLFSVHILAQGEDL